MTESSDTEITDRLLSTTRSVRKRFDFGKPVERQTILDCIALAQQAPSGSNAQGWRFVVVTDADLRAELAELYRAGARDYFAAQRASAGAGEGSDTGAGSDSGASSSGDATAKRVLESATFLAENIERVPVHVIPCIYGRPTDSVGATAGLFGSILPATWSFMLALRSRGLGSVWTTFHLAREAEAARLLGIPDTVTQAALIPVGYYTGTTFRPVHRRPPEEITYWDGWKRP